MQTNGLQNSPPGLYKYPGIVWASAKHITFAGFLQCLVYVFRMIQIRVFYLVDIAVDIHCHGLKKFDWCSLGSPEKKPRHSFCVMLELVMPLIPKLLRCWREID